MLLKLGHCRIALACSCRMPSRCGLLGCWIVVINHGLELSIKHCPGHWSVKLWWLHHDGAGLSIQSTSAAHSGFHCHQLHLELPKCCFQVALSHLCVKSRWFYVLYHLQLTAELMKILSLLLNHCHSVFSCLSSVPVIIPSNLQWPVFVAGCQFLLQSH
jgi:hypothetical protein